ncbi:MAG: hypothetical protein M1528_00845 [Candidatus Marsarchaeota archaeon]|nr:hypothetical protein [Candidatus Marsarchaeota archaeon]MCL5115067.1 hypothetical protein [Candidatus Marsarchaeota archaeon]
MPIDIKGMSLGQLLNRLHEAIVDFIETLDNTIESNRKVNTNEIRELRGHILERLQKNEDVSDNKKLIEVLDLFSTESVIMELIREDSEEWLDFIETIEERMRERGESSELAHEELADIERIKELTAQIKAILRK